MEDQFTLAEQAFQAEIANAQKKPEGKQELSPDGKIPEGEDTDPQNDGNALDTSTDDNLDVDDVGEGDAVGIPEELKGYESLIKSRGWESKIANPIEFATELLKSYENAERALGEKGNNEKTFIDRMEELEGALTGDPEELNKYRQAYGLDPIKVYNPEEEGKEAKEVFDMVDKIVSNLKNGRVDAETERKFMEWYEGKNAKLQRHLTLKEAGVIRPTVGKEKIQASALKNLREIGEENKLSHEQVVSTLDVIFKDPKVERVFTRLYGRDPSKLIATSEQAKDVFHLAKKLQLAENFDAEVKKQVTAALKKTAGRISSSGVGARGVNPQPKRPADANMAEMAAMFSGGLNGMNIH